MRAVGIYYKMLFVSDIASFGFYHLNIPKVYASFAKNESNLETGITRYELSINCYI